MRLFKLVVLLMAFAGLSLTVLPQVAQKQNPEPTPAVDQERIDKAHENLLRGSNGQGCGSRGCAKSGSPRQ